MAWPWFQIECLPVTCRVLASPFLYPSVYPTTLFLFRPPKIYGVSSVLVNNIKIENKNTQIECEYFVNYWSHFNEYIFVLLFWIGKLYKCISNVDHCVKNLKRITYYCYALFQSINTILFSQSEYFLPKIKNINNEIICYSYNQNW